MVGYRLQWPKAEGVDGYQVWSSSLPGGDYVLLGELPQADEPEFYAFVDMVPLDLTAHGTSVMALSWKPPAQIGAPLTFKIPFIQGGQSSFVPSRDVIWFQGTLPIGASWQDTSGLDVSGWAFGADHSFVVTAESGYAAPRFAGSIMPLEGTVIAWVWIPSGQVPEALWMEFHDGNGWVRSAYWGMDIFAPYPKGTDHVYMGEVPSPDTWCPLVVPLHRLRLERAYGLAFGVAHRTQEACVYWDTVACTDQPVMAAPLPHLGIRCYEIYRDGRLIATTTETSYVDTEAVDTRWVDARSSLHPAFHFENHPSGKQVTIRWAVPQGQGTTYAYEVVSVSYNGDRSSPARVSATVSSSYGKTRIYADTSPITDGTPLLAEVTGSSFVHEGLVPGTKYYYRFDVLSPAEELISRTELTHVTPRGSALDHFILDYSQLA